ncbi:F-box/WD repeat-containing protein 5 isoform X1 [Aedes albopictus]|uniref:F-box domain-containing protein n=1 Tax=Aedes albopictus TaxID=7160 RepID=A0ABM1YT48_AEDAL|nr:F-box/WD repeat-containing protein 5 isoform X1 [Aedes albopictus]XP_029714061.1 F-box/WD repeat-containing protein 5 isoform X1 [Aedes albopictus]
MSDEPSSSVEFRREGGSTNDPPEGCRSRSGSSSSSGSLVGEAEEDYCENSPWVFIPEPMFTKIFLYLEPRDMLNAGQTCKRWNKLSRDDYIWRKYFQREFNVDTNIGLKPGAESWRSEFKRLTDNVPMVMTDVLTNHSHQVLHVSFSHNGKMFATCSKDGFVIVWNSAYPSTIRDSYDMRKLSWKYTQFSQFNQSDTLLLVSGVHFGSPHSTSGEIAVFTVQNGFRLRCRVTNRPYDIFGTWFSDQHLLSGDLHWLAHLVSSSILWLNKANQEVDSEHTPIRNQLYKFYNRNASSIRAIMVANCPWLGDEKKDEEGAEGPSTSDAAGQKPTTEDEEDDRRIGNPLSHYQMNQDQAMDNMYRAGRVFIPDIDLDFPYVPLENNDYASPIHYLDEYRREYEDSYYESSDDCLDDDDDQEDDDMSETEDLDNLCPKYLIFSTGSKTYTPHQIGFKRISSVNFPRRVDPGPSLKERIALRDRQRELEVIMREMSQEEIRLQYILQNETPPMEANWANYEAVADRFDKVDKLIDLHGHIIGMGLSPDHRYLYVNSRPWPKNYVIRNPLEPPPIAQEIDIHVIDLMTLKKVGTMLRAHKAYTPNTECFFIFLDVCDNYVASGAEDMHAYLWDRYYGVCLTKYQHDDVVNSVAFNPRDNEMLVTTSDDYEIKIWRSLSQAKKLGIQPVGKAIEFRKLKSRTTACH